MRPLSLPRRLAPALLVATGAALLAGAEPPPLERFEREGRSEGRGRPEGRVTEERDPPVIFMRVDGAIGPATARYLKGAIDEAERQQARALIVELDTPGGLETSMREMVRDILAAPVPVVVWVSPRGARAASAGTFLVYAAHVAAMAPATNLGAATPVQIGGAPGQPDPSAPAAPEERELTPLDRKAVNDAAAFIRGLAELRGRDAAFAEAAVVEAATLSASEALARGVIEIVAEDRSELLRALEGRAVTLRGSTHALEVLSAPRTEIAPDWQTRLLAILSNPNVAYLLLMLGFYGLLFELSNPGAIFPGVAGAVALLLALFSLHVLPVSFAGVALLLLGIGLMIAEAFAPSFGALGAGGLVAFVFGSILLIEVEPPGFELSRPLIGAMALLSAAFFILVLRMALRSRRRKVVSGREQLLGETAVAQEAFSDRGRVRVHGELWSAVTDVPLAGGERARIVGMKGLVLQVRPERAVEGTSASPKRATEPNPQGATT
jgi:membrane-bound serine protease (ClpP class)